MDLHHAHEDLADVFDALRSSENTSYVVSSSLDLVDVNDGWTLFALRNNGARVLEEWQPVRPILEGISGDLRRFFDRGYRRALATGLRWDHDYECNSAIEYRLFRMTALPSSTTVVVTHSPLIQLPMDREVFEDTADYVSRGFITCCSHCRRTRNARHPRRWDWVPSLIATMRDDVSHGLCPACLRFYADW